MLTVFAWCFLVVFAAGCALAARWVRMTPLVRIADPATPKEKKLVGIEGWLMIFVLGQIIAILMVLGTLKEAWELSGSIWTAGDAFPILRPIAVLEGGTGALQLILPILCLALTARKHRAAPRAWFAYLVALAIASAADLGFVLKALALLRGDTSLYGTFVATELGQADPSFTQNFRLIAFGMIWSLYWARSERVRLTFGATALARGPRNTSSVSEHSTSRAPRSTERFLDGTRRPQSAASYIAPDNARPGEPKGDSHGKPAPSSASVQTSPLAVSYTPSVASMMGPPRRVLRQCPFCAEDILAQARYCKHCHRDVEPLLTPPVA